jgi:5-methylcytosine-specific restriction endonuclease McrA
VTRRPKDVVTAELRREVLERDGGCVAPRLGALSECRDRWGHIVRPDETSALTLDHVKDAPGGRRAPSDRAHLVALCWGHHLGGWATSHRPDLRAYLRAVDG